MLRVSDKRTRNRLHKGGRERGGSVVERMLRHSVVALFFLAVAASFNGASAAKQCLGVDLGSEVVRAAVAEKFGRGTQLVLNSMSGRVFPSIVGWRGVEGERLVSESAKYLVHGRPSSVVGRLRDVAAALPARDLRYRHVAGGVGSAAVRVDDAEAVVEATPLELLAAVVAHIYSAAGGPRRVAPRVAVTVPGYFTSAERHAIATACEAAGLPAPTIVSEHVAVAAAYAQVHNFVDAPQLRGADGEDGEGRRGGKKGKGGSAASSATSLKKTPVLLLSVSASSIQATLVRYALTKGNKVYGSGGSGGRLIMEKTATVASHAYSNRYGTRWVHERMLQWAVGRLLAREGAEQLPESMRTRLRDAVAYWGVGGYTGVSRETVSLDLDRGLAKALHAVRKGVEALTTTPRVVLELDALFDGVAAAAGADAAASSVALSRDDFEAATEPLRAELERVVRRCAAQYEEDYASAARLAAASAPAPSIVHKKSQRIHLPYGVELYGGGSRIPSVQATLASLLHATKVYHRLDKDEAVSAGAAAVSANATYPDPSTVRVADVLATPYLVQAHVVLEDRAEKKKGNKATAATLRQKTVFSRFIGGGAAAGRPAYLEASGILEGLAKTLGAPEWDVSDPAFAGAKRSQRPQDNHLPLRRDAGVVDELMRAGVPHSAVVGHGGLPVVRGVLVSVYAVRDPAGFYSFDALPGALASRPGGAVPLYNATAGGEGEGAASELRLEESFLIENVGQAFKAAVEDGTKQGFATGEFQAAAKKKKGSSDDVARPADVSVRIVAREDGTVGLGRAKVSVLMGKKVAAPSKKSSSAKKKADKKEKDKKGKDKEKDKDKDKPDKVVAERFERSLKVEPAPEGVNPRTLLAYFEGSLRGGDGEAMEEPRAVELRGVKVAAVREKLERLKLADDTRVERAAAKNGLEELLYDVRDYCDGMLAEIAAAAAAAATPADADAAPAVAASGCSAEALTAVLADAATSQAWLEKEDGDSHPLTEYHTKRLSLQRRYDKVRAACEAAAEEAEASAAAEDGEDAAAAEAEAEAEAESEGESKEGEDVACSSGEEAEAAAIEDELSDAADARYVFLCFFLTTCARHHFPTHSEAVSRLKALLLKERRRVKELERELGLSQ